MRTASENKSPAGRQYGLVDIMRILMAVCVLFIHRGYTMKNETLFFFIRNGICELAVPFFVVTSSYFCYKKLTNCPEGEKNRIFGKYVRHLSVLLLLWSLIYVPDFLFKECFAGGNSLYTAFTEYVRKFLISGETYLHLWYIQAMIIASVLVFFLGKKISTGTLTAVFYVLYVLYSFFLYSKNVEISRIFSLIPPALLNYTVRISIFIVSGKLLAENKITDAGHKKNVLRSSVAAAAFFGFLVLRYYRNGPGVLLQYSVLPVAVVTLFAVCITVGFSFKGQAELRKITELFYFSHLLLPVELYDLMFARLLKSALYNCFVIMTFYTVVTAAFSILLFKASKSRTFGFLRRLY